MSEQSPQAADPQNTKNDKSLLRRIAKDPLLHFLVLAGLLFVAQAIFADDDRDVIVVDVATQDFLINQEEDLRLRPLTDAEKESVVQNFIEEEILVREAVKRGFSDGSRIRALLLQNMRFFIAGDIPEPTDEILKTYFDANEEDFTSPPSFDLDHVMFNSESEIPSDILEQLNAGADPARLGDNELAFGRIMRFMTQQRLVQSFGPETARQILDAFESNDIWNGPFVSPSGTKHYLRVIQRNPPTLPDYEVAKDWIATRWLADKSRELLDDELSRVEDDYRIEVVARPQADSDV